MNRQMIKICPQCGAASPQYKEQCWICHTNLTNVRAKPVDTSTPQHHGQPTWVEKSNSSMYLVVLGALLVLVVGSGIALQNHWLLFPYLIVVCPALLVTAIRAEAQALDHRAVSPGEVVKWCFLHVIVVIASIALLIVGLFIALWAICTMNGQPSFH
jgi:ribosomal protein L40E